LIALLPPRLFISNIRRSGTCGSRRLPGVTRRLAALLAYRTETFGQNVALGNSREPPAFTFFQSRRYMAGPCQVFRRALNRLPSRLGLPRSS
jgi:hypothetical protein